jgi:hypothetical protein
MRLLRGYGKGNDELVEKAVNYAKRVILDYHSAMGKEHSQQVRVFVDNRRAKATGELNKAYEKVKLAPIDVDDEEFKFVDDRIMGALVVYARHMRMESASIQDLELLVPIQEELDMIEKHKALAPKDSNYEIYVTMFDEIYVYRDNL